MNLKYTLYETLEEETANTHYVRVYDPTSVDWSTFSWSNGYYKHKLTRTEILKPYLVSYAYYGTVEYEYIILILNQIDDVWELPIGTEIKVPKLVDIKQFLRDNRL